MSEPVLYATDTLTLAQLKQTLKNAKKFSKLGFYVEAEETAAGKFFVSLYGPKIQWRKRTVIVWEIVDANKTGVSN